MNRTIRIVSGAAGIACILYAAERLQAVPSYPPRALKCGNCWLAATLMPVEIATLGVLLVLLSLLGIRLRPRHLSAFAMLVAGILFTPLLIGVPVFALGLAVLVFSFFPRQNAILMPKR